MKGDIRYTETTRLLAYCPKCRRTVETVQTVDRYRDIAVIKQYCSRCERLLHTERYPIASAEETRRRLYGRT